MTISNTNRLAGPFTGNGSTTNFPFSFKVFSESDLLVVTADTDGTETDLTIGLDYTVSLNSDQNGNPGGSVSLLSALTSGYSMVITSEISSTQLVELTNAGGFYPEVINDALDKITILVSQLEEKVSRTLQTSITSGSSDAFFGEIYSYLGYIETVYYNISHIVSVSNDIANIDIAADSIPEINAVSPYIGDVHGALPEIISVLDYMPSIEALIPYLSDISQAAIVFSATSPVSPLSGMRWYDTSTDTLYFRSSHNTYWVKMFDFDGSSAVAAGGFPPGTSILFNQATPPVGWTKDTGWENRTVITGDTYGNGGSDSPVSWTTAIDVENHSDHTHIGPSHYHSMLDHTHNVIVPKSGWTGAGSQPSGVLGFSTGVDGYNSGITVDKTITSGIPSTGSTAASGTLSTGVSSTSHARTHTITQDTMTAKYQIMITATRN